jgi:hypothetical protein
MRREVERTEAYVDRFAMERAVMVRAVTLRFGSERSKAPFVEDETRRAAQRAADEVVRVGQRKRRRITFSDTNPDPIVVMQQLPDDEAQRTTNDIYDELRKWSLVHTRAQMMQAASRLHSAICDTTTALVRGHIEALSRALQAKASLVRDLVDGGDTAVLVDAALRPIGSEMGRETFRGRR